MINKVTVQARWNFAGALGRNVGGIALGNPPGPIDMCFRERSFYQRCPRVAMKDEQSGGKRDLTYRIMTFDPGLFITINVIPTNCPGVRAPEKHKAAIITCLWTSEPIRAGPLPGSVRPRVHTSMEIQWRRKQISAGQGMLAEADRRNGEEYQSLLRTMIIYHSPTPDVLSHKRVTHGGSRER